MTRTPMPKAMEYYEPNVLALAEFAYTHLLKGDNESREECEAQIRKMNRPDDMPRWIQCNRSWFHAANVASMWLWVRNYGRGYFVR